MYVTSAYEYIFKVPCGNYKLKPIRGMPKRYDWSSSAGRRMDISRHHRVQAGSGGHSMSYPEGTIAIFSLVTQAVFLEFEMTLTPSKAEVKNAKIRTRPNGMLYVYACCLS